MTDTDRVMTTARLPRSLLEHLDAIADRHGLDRTTVMQRFLEAGRDANPPVSVDELERARDRRQKKPRSPVPMVIPEAPLASGASGGGQLLCLADYVGPVLRVQESGGENGIPGHVTR